MSLWTNLGIIFMLVAVMTYAIIYVVNKKTLVGYRARDVLSLLLSHVPDLDSRAWPHVLAGVSLCLGLCLLVGSIVANMRFVAADFSRHSTALTTGSLTFTVLISIISFLTLWQTKKIEQAQGANIEGFHDLILKMEADIRALNGDFLTNGMRVRDHHRVLLVTTNPFLGKLSFPTDPQIHAFSDALRQSATNVSSPMQDGGDERFRLDVLCGDRDAINEFHRIFYRRKEVVAAADDPQVKRATDEAERLISEFDAAAGHRVIHRVRRVPKTQFCIVGNVVYEFILETPGFHSEVRRARRIGDKVVCDRFIETFALLKDLAVIGERTDQPQMRSGAESVEARVDPMAVPLN